MLDAITCICERNDAEPYINTNGATSGCETYQPTYSAPRVITSYANPAPPMLVNRATNQITIQVDEGKSEVEFSISPALPAGLTLNTRTGVISGTPTVDSPYTTYQVTIKNPQGSTTAAVSFYVEPARNKDYAYTGGDNGTCECAGKKIILFCYVYMNN